MLDRVLPRLRDELGLLPGFWQYRIAYIFDMSEEYSEMERKAMEKMMAFRIDYLARDRQGYYHIFEIKRDLGLHALGQLLAYRLLIATIEGIPESRIKLHVIYEKTYETIKFIYREFNIQLWEV